MILIISDPSISIEFVILFNDIITLFRRSSHLMLKSSKRASSAETKHPTIHHRDPQRFTCSKRLRYFIVMKFISTIRLNYHKNWCLLKVYYTRLLIIFSRKWSFIVLVIFVTVHFNTWYQFTLIERLSASFDQVYTNNVWDCS